jgi:hypothetical protein
MQKGNQLLVIHKDVLMPDEVLYAFNDADSTELLRLIGGKISSGGNGDSVQQSADCLIAITDGAITARAGTTLGTGQASVQRIDDAGVATNMYKVDVLNAGTRILDDAWVMLFRVGNRFLAVEVC